MKRTIALLLVGLTFLLSGCCGGGKSVNEEHIDWANQACAEDEGVQELVQDGVVCKDGLALNWEH